MSSSSSSLRAVDGVAGFDARNSFTGGGAVDGRESPRELRGDATPDDAGRDGSLDRGVLYADMVAFELRRPALRAARSTSLQASCTMIKLSAQAMESF
jgi:hypothetical protein